MLRSETRARYVNNLLNYSALLVDSGHIKLADGDDKGTFLLELKTELDCTSDYGIIDQHQLTFGENHQHHVDRCLRNLKNYLPAEGMKPDTALEFSKFMSVMNKLPSPTTRN